MQNKARFETEESAEARDGELLSIRSALLSLFPAQKRYFANYAEEVSNQNLEFVGAIGIFGLLATAVFCVIGHAMDSSWRPTSWCWLQALCMALACAAAWLCPKKVRRNRYYAAAVTALFMAATLVCALQIDLSMPGSCIVLPVAYMLLCTLLVQPVYLSAPLMLAAQVWFTVGLLQRQTLADAAPELCGSLISFLAASIAGFSLAAVTTQSNVRMRRFRALSRMDSLTGLLNKGSAEALAAEYLATREPSEPCALLVMDVDDFKVVNDTDGHAQGDRVLAKVSEALHATFRASDIVGRIGGDEFLILAKNIRDRATLEKKCAGIHDAILKIHAANGTVGCSIGAAWLKEGRIEYEELFQTADAAVYVSKATGKGRDEIREVTGHGHRAMMLVVDDQMTSRRMIRASFGEEYTVLEAGSGTRAMDLLEQYGKRINVILLDVLMPGMSGLEVLREIRKRYSAREMPVLIVTADPDSEREALQLGANDVIAKPFDHDIVRMRIRIARGEQDRPLL